LNDSLIENRRVQKHLAILSIETGGKLRQAQGARFKTTIKATAVQPEKQISISLHFVLRLLSNTYAMN
jgi:hypothetical protein